MNSSMLAGERRWASARRGGMTVLGKVAVPKPLNLPSQRLENHGLDPNVEIVPKGTLSWGSRPSSSGSNPWMSSSLSPNAEGGAVSPSHFSGAPSSGGSCTRPSTAGSERTHEPVANTWGSNTRPSSASGTLSSNQTSSTSLRPKSAENRPNSSHLSRFADPLSKSSAAWGTSGTAERLGVKSVKEDGFSLSSGDFPTLGTEKDNFMKNTDLEDAKHGLVNTWRADDLQAPDDDTHHPSIEKWHEDPPQYFNPNASSQNFDTWRGAPLVNGPVPAGVWFGGQRPRCPPFGEPVHPGGFRMEPFPYYRPPSLAGSQSGPPPGPSGPHPRNGDLYRPQISDGYTRPSMPFRPGFYPAPSGPPGNMTFEGYYGPPGMGSDMSYMGVSAGPPVYNGGYPSPVLDIGNSHGRNARSHHTSKTSSEKVEADDTREPKRLTLKTRNQCDQRDEGGIREQHSQPDASYFGKNRLPMIFPRTNEWGAEEDTDESMYAKRMTPSDKPLHNSEHRGQSADVVKVKLLEGMRNVKAFDDDWTNVSESVSAFPPEAPRVPLGSERDSSLSSVTKQLALVHELDGLNVKTCVSDGRNDPPRAYKTEDSDTTTNKNTVDVSNTAGSVERAPVGDKPVQPVIAVCRRPHHGGQVRVDNRGRGKFDSQDTDKWRESLLTAESSSVITASHNESGLSSHAHGLNNVEDASEINVINPVGKVEGDSIESHDSSDFQRAKMREIAKQRALQREKEEEERTSEQRAKALAKLKELNRRTLAGEARSEKSDKNRITNDIPGEEQYESCTVDELVLPDIINANWAGESAELPIGLPFEADVSTLPAHEDAHDGSVRKIISSQFNDSRQKRTGYNKHRQSNSFQKRFTEKTLSNVPPGPQKDHTFDENKLQEHPSSEIKFGESSIPDNFETPESQRRKSNKSGKNKHKMDQTPSPPVRSVADPGNVSIEKIESETSLANWESSFSIGIEPDRPVKAQEVLCPSLSNEESRNRAANQWRPQAPHRLPRNQQVNSKPRGGDTAMWAPVPTQNKANGSFEASRVSVDESANSAKSNINIGKRAEMERYVPKPVVKELIQQVNDPNSSSWITTSRSNDRSSGEVNEGDLSHIKHKNDQGTWKKRGLSDSSYIKNAHIGLGFVPKSTKEIQEPNAIGESVKNEINHSMTSKEKRNWPKSPTTSITDNTEPEKIYRGEINVNQMERSKENRTWQPKSCLKTGNSQHGSRVKSLTMETKKKEHVQESNVGHCRGSEKKAKGRPYTPNQGQSVGPGGLTHAHVERNIPLGSRKNDRQNNRSFRGNDNNTRGDWSYSGHDNRPHNAPPFRDNNNKNRQSLQFEYQPAVTFKGNRPEKVELNDGVDNLEQRHRERGQSHSRRGGNFNIRQSGATARLDSGWD